MTEEKQIKEVVFTISKGSWDDVLMVQVEIDPSIIDEHDDDSLDHDLYKRIKEFLLETSGREIPLLCTVAGIKVRLLGVEAKNEAVADRTKGGAQC